MLLLAPPFLLVLLIAWRISAAHVCHGCYRLGNYLDFYLQRELLLQASAASATSSGAEVANSASSGPAALARGIWTGVWLKRFLHFRWTAPATLIEHLHSQRLSHLSRSWQRPEAAQLLRALVAGGLASARSGQPEFFLWWNQTLLHEMLPEVRDAVRAAVDAVVPQAGAPPPGTCVVHFRAGDFTNEVAGGWKPAQLRLCIAAMAAAARTFPTAVQRFEVLGGGVDHGCDPQVADCGQSALQLLERNLRAAVPNASVVHVRGASADADFARMVRAPMLLVGSFGTELKVGSSFAVFAAAASAGHVRSPACFMRHDQCMPARAMAPNWLGYEHPACKQCRLQFWPGSGRPAKVYGRTVS